MDVFKFADIALGSFSHNASPLRATNGSYLLFHIGRGDANSSSSFLHHSESPSGPWIPLAGPYCNNPAPMIHPNGTFFVGCNNGGFEIYRTDNPFNDSNENWEFVTTMDFPKEWKYPQDELRSEDPYLWADHNGNFHLLAHRYDYRDGWPVRK